MKFGTVSSLRGSEIAHRSEFLIPERRFASSLPPRLRSVTILTQTVGNLSETVGNLTQKVDKLTDTVDTLVKGLLGPNGKE